MVCGAHKLGTISTSREDKSGESLPKYLSYINWVVPISEVLQMSALVIPFFREGSNDRIVALLRGGLGEQRFPFRGYLRRVLGAERTRPFIGAGPSHLPRPIWPATVVLPASDSPSRRKVTG